MMLRKSARVAGRVAVSAALSWTLIPIAIADAPAPMPVDAAAAPQPGEPSGKQLFTVPEDGMGDTHWLSGATRVVREILLKRPNEDLVICVAGCIAKQDRVVYAQPTDPQAAKPRDLLSDGAPAMPAEKPEAAASAEAKTPDPQTAEPQTSDTKTSETKAAEPAIPTPLNSQAEPAAAEAAPANEQRETLPEEKTLAAPGDAQPAPAPATDRGIALPEPSTDHAAPPKDEPDSAPAIAPAAKAAPDDDSARMDFVPSMAVPNGDTPSSEPTNEPVTEPSVDRDNPETLPAPALD